MLPFQPETESSFSHIRKAWLYPLYLVTAMLFCVSCGEEDAPGDTGLPVIPDSDLISIVFTDTATIEMETQVLDDVTSGNALIQLVGNYIDPEFGRISATTYTDFRLPGVEVSFGDSADLRFTSLTLNLQFINVYGRIESLQEMRVFELLDPLPDDASSLTTSSAPPRTSTTELSGGFAVDFREEGTVASLSIPLSDELGKKLLYADESDLNDNAVFRQFFNGLAIGTAPVTYLSREPGAIYGVFLDGTESNLQLVYEKRDSAGGAFEEQTFDFVINEDAQKYHSITRTDLGGSQLLGMPDALTNGVNHFLQSGAMIKLFINFPTITSFGQVGVNRADFILKVDPDFLGSNNRFAPPSAIRMLIADENRIEALSSTGGVIINTEAPYDSENNEYSFTVTNYVQEVLSDRRTNNGFILVAPDSNISVNRAVFGGNNHPMLKPVLKLTYTTLPK